ncbi:MAG TPA: LytR C-terminal domain-containing protein, partial [Ilumatobacteraceae bacterium]|nr:LytR C-terminal domain-containing protein [Ilumatobacteraceae bacterium]
PFAQQPVVQVQDSAGNPVPAGTTTIVPADFPVLIVNASHQGTAEEAVALRYPGVRMTTATSTVRESVVLATEASLDRASTIASDLGIAYSSPIAPGVKLGLDTPLVPAGTDLTGIDVIVIIGDDLAPDQGLAVTTTTVCLPTVPTTETGPTTSTGGSTTTTSIVLDDFTSTKVQVANCSAQNGVAQMMSQVLTDAGFTTADAVNGMCDPKLDSSYVIYDESVPGAQAVAETVARTLGGITVEAAVLPIRTESGAWAEGSGVVVLLGNDLAGKTLDQITNPTTTIAQP